MVEKKENFQKDLVGFFIFKRYHRFLSIFNSRNIKNVVKREVFGRQKANLGAGLNISRETHSNIHVSVLGKN